MGEAVLPSTGRNGNAPVRNAHAVDMTKRSSKRGSRPRTNPRKPVDNRLIPFVSFLLKGGRNPERGWTEFDERRISVSTPRSVGHAMTVPKGQHSFSPCTTIEEIDAELDRTIEEIQARSASEIRMAVAEANQQRDRLATDLVFSHIQASVEASRKQRFVKGADHRPVRKSSGVDSTKPKHLKVRTHKSSKRPSSEVILQHLVQNDGRATAAAVYKAVVNEGWTKDAGVKSRDRLLDRGLIMLDGTDWVLTERAKDGAMEVETER